MSTPTSGKTYRFNNAGAPIKRLNLFSSGNVSDGMNVCLYDEDETNEQQWIYKNDRLYIKTNPAYCLDRYTGSDAPGNADIYQALAKYDNDQKIIFEDGGSYVKIRLMCADLYLTAYSMNNKNGTGTGKLVSSAGNVFWAAQSSDPMQRWTFSEVTADGEDSAPAKNYATYPVKTMNITQAYRDGNHAAYSDYPFDEACESSGRSYMHCPCDEMKVSRIYGVGSAGTNTIWLESTAKVSMPCGTDVLTIMVMHPDDDDLSRIAVGRKFTRGQAMFREGTNGFATGNHFHVSVGTGGVLGNGWTQNSNGAWCISTTGGAIKAEQAFFLDPGFTVVKNAKGIKLPLLL